MYRTTTMKRVLLLLITTAAALITETPVFPQISISTIEELQKIGNDPSYPLNGSYCLVNDIDASATKSWNDGMGFKPIGAFDKAFIGILEGNNKAIYNLYINRPDKNYVGIFAGAYNGNILNLKLINAEVVGKYTVGSIAGYGCNLKNCYASGKIYGKEWWTGGIVGQGSLIDNCSFSGKVMGYKYVGGLVGSGDASNSWAFCEVIGDSYVGGIAGACGTIKNCYATGSVEGNDCVGGMSGQNGGTISDCYANVHVVGHGDYNGGLVGLNHTVIERSYATGKVDAGVWRTGGLVGASFYNPGSPPYDVRYSFYDTNTTGQYCPGDYLSGYPKTTAEMMTQATFTTWDFQNVWWMIPGKTYPLLRPVRYVGLNIKPEQSFGLPAEYKIIFDEPVRNFSFDDVDLSLSTIEGIQGTLTPDDAPTTITAWDCFTSWTLRLEDAASTTGLIVMRLPIAAAMNAANYPTAESAFIRIPLLQPARGDLNYDGDVNAADRAILIEMILNPQSLWLKRLLPSEYDLNSDSKLDIGDVVIFLGF